MTNDPESIRNLEARLQALLKRQQEFSAEIRELQEAIAKLSEEKTVAPEPTPKKEVVQEAVEPFAKEQPTPPPPPPPTSAPKPHPIPPKPKKKSDWERFIGENIINKIGIVVTIIGVIIGAKYTIENDLISPLTRIILGYLTGIGLLLFGMRLKKNYENFSAVLVSGAMVVMYFISYAAYSFYDLIPQWVAFTLMVIFTAFTVFAAIQYKQQIIAHLGLVGAYTVPFLLGDDPGQAKVLFSYIAIINLGILIISFMKYWKSLHYSAFFFTWAIFTSWYFDAYETSQFFWLALAFETIFFVIFYVNFLSYKLIKKEKFDLGDIILLLANSFIFYGLGYDTLSGHETGEQLLGLFTICNAVVHFIVGLIIYRQKLADKNLFYLVFGLVLVFLTLAIPVQLDGNWVTILWITEAALLFWIGRTKKVAIYEQLSYILIALSVFSLIHDWFSLDSYSRYNEDSVWITPVFNIDFLTSAIVIGAFAFILYIHRKYVMNHVNQWNNAMYQLFSVVLPGVFILVTYVALRIELSRYFDQLIEYTAVEIPSSSSSGYGLFELNYDINKFKTVWIHIYSMLFLSLVGFINLKRFKNQALAVVLFGFSLVAILAFLIQGYFSLEDLRQSYLSDTPNEYFSAGIFHMLIRYVAFGAVAILILVQKTTLRKIDGLTPLKLPFEILQYLILLAILSSELVHWMDVAGVEVPFKLGLSILWGVYALVLIILGIWRRKAYLRILAIVIFGITLLKLFFYDIAHLNTISKTIVFVSLGTLLLIISYLYNKFKSKISNENDS